MSEQRWSIVDEIAHELNTGDRPDGAIDDLAYPDENAPDYQKHIEDEMERDQTAPLCKCGCVYLAHVDHNHEPTPCWNCAQTNNPFCHKYEAAS